MNRTDKRYSRSTHRAAFTFIETLTAVLLTGLLLTALLALFSQLRRGMARLAEPMQQDRLAYEILQKIAEDIDRIAAPGFEAGLQFRNKFDNGLNSAQLLVENKYYGSAIPPTAEIFDRVIWQTQYDPFTKSLILYRLHEGLNLEDKIIEQTAARSPSLGMFIPVTDGLTHFEVVIVDGQTTLFQWTNPTLPTSIRIGISFAPPAPLPDGRVAVPTEAIIYRTVAIDRTRVIPYEFIAKPLDAAVGKPQQTDQQEQTPSTDQAAPNQTPPATPETPAKPTTPAQPAKPQLPTAPQLPGQKR